MNAASKMVTIQTTELIGPALGWAVATCEKVNVRWSKPHEQLLVVGYSYLVWHPHEDPKVGWPIIEREEITIDYRENETQARKWVDGDFIEARAGKRQGLIAAMRAYVASVYGDEVEIPEELT